MNIDQELITEIESELHEDILHFAWLCQISQNHNPVQTRRQAVESILKSVAHLHQIGTIVVGDAREADETVLIDPWPESKTALRVRLDSTIAKSSHDDFCFWIQLVKHNAAQPAPEK